MRGCAAPAPQGGPNYTQDDVECKALLINSVNFGMHQFASMSVLGIQLLLLATKDILSLRNC